LSTFWQFMASKLLLKKLRYHEKLLGTSLQVQSIGYQEHQNLYKYNQEACRAEHL